MKKSKKSKQALSIAAALAETYPDAECALKHRTPFQLLVATILSAQTTDEKVNEATPALFKQFGTAAKMARADVEVLEELVRTLNFYRTKAKNIRAMAERVVADHKGKLPQTVEELIKLPGVGRKTANVLLGTAYRIPTGVVVDTHVKRITNLLGLTTQKDPEKIEKDLMNVLPEEEWIDFAHRLIWHGRKVCVARRPDCENCTLLGHCDRIGLPKLK